jgi:hypothetical protein
VKLHVIVAATYPLARTAEAHRGGQAGQASGKLALIS